MCRVARNSCRYPKFGSTKFPGKTVSTENQQFMLQQHLSSFFSHQTYYFRDWFRVELKPRIFGTQNTSLIGSRLIDFSLYWNWCRWFSVLLLCKSNSYVLEMMNDEVLGMECTSLFLLFFRENKNSGKYAHALFLDIYATTQTILRTCTTRFDIYIFGFFRRKRFL